MEFTLQIDDKLFEQPIKDAVSRAVNSVVATAVSNKIIEYRSDIDQAVELYLAKRLTDKEIKSEIDKAVERIINERLEDRL
jgi:hypothetical protein